VPPEAGEIPEDGEIDLVVLDAVLSRIVPPDEHGADARELGLRAFVLARLRGARRSEAPTWVAGLRELDSRTRARHGHGFAAASAEIQDAVLSEVELEESQLPPWQRGGAFFESVLRYAREGMFGDPAYGGNPDGRGWDLLGYPDPRPVWTEADQRMDVVIIPLQPRSARRPRMTP